jgi:hypothetical protein
MGRATIQSSCERRAADEPLYDQDPQTGATLEVFHADAVLARSFGMHSGFFWWSCLPGCLPGIRPHGPFATCYGAYRNALTRGTKPSPFGKRIR